MTEYEKMLAGLDYDGGDSYINGIKHLAYQAQQRINHAESVEQAQQESRSLMTLGQGCWITPPFHCEFGRHIEMGERCFLNMGVTMLDGARITLGRNVMVGPNCQFYTAGHSLDYHQRRNWQTICRPIVVEDDVWIGGSVVIAQGVTIGRGAVIAANSTVTRDVEPLTLMAGSPARCIRRLEVGESVEMCSQ
ncbi:sugar O-acetyltransferase [Ferrimonas sp. SCSIO 43195]|uniref:sugar O-acetyltransferase n=1 Tax=Ferrimonas sp. SCSIO 43195 TaxID=2822844 RepID=UPI0020756077|nr:sugar O-acetyltransferase [Ferrimonas sp. SCSIO 43195]USD38558.1 sugar O-acetyltransferase [Ferrimonas sp. SCSIO 43195]